MTFLTTWVATCLTKTNGNQTTTEARNHSTSDQITSIANKAAIHDLKGNLTDYEINGKDYTVRYDLDNRITRVDTTKAVAYRYDALGHRVIRKEGSSKSALIWWGNSENAEHKHQAGQTVIQNDIMSHPTRLNAVIARAVTGSKTSLQWYHKNYLDHVYAVSNKRGRLREHYRYTAFGEVTIYDDNGNVETESQIENTIMWNTRRRDTVTGFYLYKYRHYDPQLGRWPSRDPIEEDGGVNLYAFVGNDPVGKWDELGLAWRCETTHSRSCEGESTEEDEGAGDTTFVSTCSFVPCEYMEVIGYGASSDRGTAMLFSYLDAVSKNLGDCPEGCTGNDLFSSTTCEEIDTSA